MTVSYCLSSTDSQLLQISKSLPFETASTDGHPASLQKGTATVRQVLDRLPETREISYKTVQTFLRRLEAKGYVSSKFEGRSLVYSPQIRPRKVIRDAVTDLINRLFHGDPQLLIEHLMAEQKLSSTDTVEIASCGSEPAAEEANSQTP